MSGETAGLRSLNIAARYRSDREDVVAVVQRDGGVIVRNLVAESLMDAIHDELKPFIEATKVGTDNFGGFRTQRTRNRARCFFGLCGRRRERGHRRQESGDGHVDRSDQERHG